MIGVVVVVAATTATSAVGIGLALFAIVVLHERFRLLPVMICGRQEHIVAVVGTFLARVVAVGRVRGMCRLNINVRLVVARRLSAAGA